MRRLLAGLVLALIVAAPLRAQVPATLVADSLTVDGQTLTARGNVEVFFDGTRLSARAVVYDRATDRLILEGPIFIEGPDGEILTAERAELDPRLEAGILLGARLVLDRQLQLAAGAIERRTPVSRLTGVAATSCRVCGTRPPLWEIRAERVTHDDEARQLWFENAQFRVRGVPILWIPRMRLPDPSLGRARGWLVPELVTTNQLSTGLKLPYFIPFGDRRDLTLTPYWSSETRTLEARYRQAYLGGTLQIDAAVSRDTLRPGELRGYVFAEADFRTATGTRLDFDLQMVSDDAYLLDYSVSDADFLISNATATQVTAESYLSYGVTHVRSLRDGDPNDELPGLLPVVTYERRLFPAALGGTLTLTGSADGAIRSSDDPVAGRDTGRFSFGGRWERSAVTGFGLVATGGLGIDWDHYRIAEDPGFPASLDRVTTHADLTLRYPLRRVGPGGGVQTLEPVLQLAWAGTRGESPPNEDSTLPEFDEGNLFALSRFPGEDRRETGARAALGVHWMRIGPEGGSARLTFGRIWRNEANPDLTSASGLEATASDWLISGALEVPGGARIEARALLDPGFGFEKSAARLSWSSDRVDLAAAYVFVPADPAEDRLQDASEWSFDVDYQINPTWSLGAEARYDLTADSPAFAGLRVGYTNECVSARLSVSRRFTSSDSVEPSTSLGLNVELLGFSAGRPATPDSRACGP